MQKLNQAQDHRQSIKNLRSIFPHLCSSRNYKRVVDLCIVLRIDVVCITRMTICKNGYPDYSITSSEGNTNISSFASSVLPFTWLRRGRNQLTWTTAAYSLDVLGIEKIRIKKRTCNLWMNSCKRNWDLFVVGDLNKRNSLIIKP